MRFPKRIQPLIDDGLVDEVVQQLMSGKEATVYVVRCGDEFRCAKIYKEAYKRSFKKAVQYQEGRKQRNSRSARAMEKGSKFGRDQQEESWQNAEVDALYKLGVVYHRLGDNSRSLEYLNRVQADYPTTSAAGLATTYASELQ